MIKGILDEIKDEIEDLRESEGGGPRDLVEAALQLILPLQEDLDWSHRRVLIRAAAALILAIEALDAREEWDVY